MRIRLRPAWTEDQLRALYASPHRHDQWRDHRLRVAITSAFTAWWPDMGSVADLSCGDATIAKAFNAPHTILGDYAPGYEITGPIEETLYQVERVDLWVLSETVEHLDDPDMVLRALRPRAARLLLSTPIGEVEPEDNPEHLWGWDMGGVYDMVRGAGWSPEVEIRLGLPGWTYDYQIWGLS